MKIREILESATAGAMSSSDFSVGVVYKNKPGKTAKNKEWIFYRTPVIIVVVILTNLRLTYLSK